MHLFSSVDVSTFSPKAYQHNNNTDFTYKHFSFYFLVFSKHALFLLGYNKVDKKQKFSAFDLVE